MHYCSGNDPTILQQYCKNVAVQCSIGNDRTIFLQYCAHIDVQCSSGNDPTIFRQYCAHIGNDRNFCYIARTSTCNGPLTTILQYFGNIARTSPCNVPLATILQYFGNIARTSMCNVSVATTQKNCLHIAVQYCSGNIVETVQQYSEATMTLTKFEI